MAALKAASADFHDKTIHTNDAAALAKQATADKNASRERFEAQIRSVVRQIKAGSNYSEGQGAQLGIVGPERTQDLATSHPDLSGIDQTGGRVALSFTNIKVMASIFTANVKTMPIGYYWAVLPSRLFWIIVRCSKPENPSCAVIPPSSC